MLTLALESTAAIASASLAEDGRCLYLVQSDCGLTHSEQLLPMVQEALRATGKRVADIDLFACTVGPGSFTGVRIAAAVLKGLAFNSGKPCAPVSTLLSLAQNLSPLEGIFCPVMDARRDQVYTAQFACRDGRMTRESEDEALSLAQLADRLRRYEGQPIYLCGDGYDLAHSTLREAGIVLCDTPRLLRGQNAFSTALCAERMFRDGETVPEPELLPTYLRMPQAERERLAAEATRSAAK